MTHEKLEDTDNKAASIGTNIDTISTNMNNMGVSEEDNSVPKHAEFGKESEIPSNKKECTSYAQNLVDDNSVDLSGALHNLTQLNITSNVHEDEHTSSSFGFDASSSNDSTNADDIAADYRRNKLFLDPPPKEDCPICMLPMPHASGACGVGKTYMACCGTMICSGCSKAEDGEVEKGNIKAWCAFCRVPIPTTDEENIKRVMVRCEQNDANAFYKLGLLYRDGSMGLPQDTNKSIELIIRGADLGSLEAHWSLTSTYLFGRGAEKDVKRGVHHLSFATMGGHEMARYFCGQMESQKSMNRAMKHHMIAAKAGVDLSLKKVGEGFKAGHVTKDEYASTLRAHQASIAAMKSEQRTKAAEED